MLLVVNYRWNGTNGNDWKGQLNGADAGGYYEYLPALFIRHDLDRLKPELGFVRNQDERQVIKYPPGVAVLLFPFFELGHLLAWAGNFETSGYSEPYLKCVSLAAIFYLGLGLLALRKLLLLLNIKEGVIAVVLLLLVLGTNLGYYAVIKSGMSHVYSFAIIACFIYCIVSYFERSKPRYFVGAALFLAIALLIRPTNVVIILMLPFAAGSFSRLNFFFNNRKVFAIAAIIFLMVWSIQLISWHHQSGSWWVWAYKGEGFYFFHPEILNVLFSFRKGFFLYTPLALISLVGLLPLYKMNRTKFYALVVTLTFAIYLISAWWCWSYQDSFGMRPFIDYYSLFGILLALLLNGLSSLISKIIVYTLCLFCMLLNLVQSYQYYKGIIHPFCMNEEKYKYVFLKTNEKYVNCLGGNIDLQPYSTRELQLIHSYVNDYEKEVADFTNGEISDMGFCGEPQSHCCHYSDRNEFGTELSIKPESAKVVSGIGVSTLHEVLFAKIELKRYETSFNSSSGALLAIDITSDKSEYYNAIPLNDTPSEEAGKWKKYNYTFEIPKPLSPNGVIKIYVWNRGKKDFYIDDFKVQIFKLFP